MKKSLVELAAINKLPKLQLMDKETLNWIKKNKPSFRNTGKIRMPKISVIKNFIPDAKWFLQKKQIDSIHGYRHLLRTALWTMIYSSSIKYSGNVKNIIIASVLHDIRRRNDKDDKMHGLRAANWMKKNVAEIEKKFSVSFIAKDIEEIYWSIAFHDISGDEILNNKNYLKFKESIKIIKAADALDRYRLPKLKWWINDKKLGVKVDNSVKKLAYNFIVQSEQKFLSGKDSIESILMNLK